MIIAVVLLGHRARPRRAVHRAARRRRRRRGPLGRRHGRHRARHPRLAGGRRVRSALLHRGRRWSRSGRSPAGWCGASASGKPTLLDPDLFRSQAVPARDLRPDAAADRARRDDDRAADLPADGARVQRDAGRPVARAAVAEHVRGRRCSPASRPGERRPAAIIRAGFALLAVGMRRADPDRPARRLRLVPRRPAARSPGAGSACWSRS